jgi:hypothetical protein
MTLTTIGYGDLTTLTDSGRALEMILAIFGTYTIIVIIIIIWYIFGTEGVGNDPRHILYIYYYYYYYYLVHIWDRGRWK